jgi:hypothetical protein
MKRTRRRKCAHCKELFRADRRNAWHQRYCDKGCCRAESKREAQSKWNRKPGNRGYFRGPEQVERTRQWRRGHPGYWKQPALQDVIMSQPVETNSESGTYTTSSGQRTPKSHALQDVISAQSTVLIGLIATLSDSALQDDIAITARRLLSRGHDVMRMYGKDCNSA